MKLVCHLPSDPLDSLSRVSSRSLSPHYLLPRHPQTPQLTSLALSPAIRLSKASTFGTLLSMTLLSYRPPMLCLAFHSSFAHANSEKLGLGGSHVMPSDAARAPDRLPLSLERPCRCRRDINRSHDRAPTKAMIHAYKLGETWLEGVSCDAM